MLHVSKFTHRAGAVAQGLRSLAGLPEDPVSNPRIHREAQKSHTHMHYPRWPEEGIRSLVPRVTDAWELVRVLGAEAGSSRAADALNH